MRCDMIRNDPIYNLTLSSLFLLFCKCNLQLGVFPHLEVVKGDNDLIEYEHTRGSGVVRKSCKKCGSFCYKLLGPEAKVAPLGALSGDVVKPTCHIFVKDKGHQDIMFDTLPKHDAMP